MSDFSTVGPLWPEMRFVQRSWLSANNIVFNQGRTAVVDTGYCTEAAATVQGVRQALHGQTLAHIVNTHLHSDHCGGNAALQAAWPQVQTWVAPGQLALVQAWDPVGLSYAPTGQRCPQFRADGVVQPGATVQLGLRDWQVHAAPGHDPHSVVLFEPQRRLLISADALWERGFGVVFPELEGEQAFAEVEATLDVIEQLQPEWVLPGHGSMFSDVAGALAVARKRLADFQADPQRHAQYAAKVLLKYKLLEWQQASCQQVQDWCASTPLMQQMRQRYFADQDPAAWVLALLQALAAARAVVWEGDQVRNVD